MGLALAVYPLSEVCPAIGIALQALTLGRSQAAHNPADDFFNYDRSIIRNSAVVVACYGRGQHTIAVATCVIADNIRVLVIPTADRWGAIITNDHVWFCSGGVAYRIDVVKVAICINNSIAAALTPGANFQSVGFGILKTADPMLVTLLQSIGGITRLPDTKTRSLSKGFVTGRNLEVYGDGICAICCSRAVFSSSGSCLPRRDARRKMPSQAFRLK